MEVSKKTNAKVCIIILNWNGLTNTINCFKSLLKTKGIDYKVILIDNGSKNNEGESLKKLFGNKADIHILAENLGFTGGNNFGILYGQEKYNPDYFLLLNNDTEVDPDFLKYLVNTGSKSNRIGIVAPLIYDYRRRDKIIFAGEKINWLLAKPYHLTVNPKKIKSFNFLTGCCLLIKSEVIKRIGLFDERFFAYFEDSAFCLKAQKAGYLCVCNPKAKIYHWQSASSDKKGKFFTYLISRNRILFVNNYFPLLYRGYFYIFNFSKLIFVISYLLITLQNDRAYAFFKGYLDGINNIGGKPNI